MVDRVQVGDIFEITGSFYTISHVYENYTVNIYSHQAEDEYLHQTIVRGYDFIYKSHRARGGCLN